MMGPAKGAKDQQHRHHGQILEQQDGETGAAGNGIEPLLLRQDLDHYRRGRHCQR
jgi:hypothetical protein